MSQIDNINEYINNRTDLYVEGISRLDKISKWIPQEQILALVKQTQSIASALNISSAKLYEYTQDAVGISESILSSAQNKITFVENTISMLSALYGQKNQVGNVSVINLTSGDFTNMIYSSTDGGLIMEYQDAT